MTTSQYNPILRVAMHFVPLFSVALAAWLTLQAVMASGTHMIPGLIAAMVLGAAGTYIALRGGSIRDLRSRDAVQGYEVRQSQRTTARTGSSFTVRAPGSRIGNAIGN